VLEPMRPVSLVFLAAWFPQSIGADVLRSDCGMLSITFFDFPKNLDSSLNLLLFSPKRFPDYLLSTFLFCVCFSLDFEF
jgi:hypothetical protein